MDFNKYPRLCGGTFFTLILQALLGFVMDILIFRVLPVENAHTASRSSQQILKMRLLSLLMHSISRIYGTWDNSKPHTTEKQLDHSQ